MEAGLGVLKFSLDAMDERKIQKIRGKKANFAESIEKILKLLEIKDKRNFKTLLVPCMIDLAFDGQDTTMHKEFLRFWSDKKVFAYIKSQDNRWLYENDKYLKSKSHYANQYWEKYQKLREMHVTGNFPKGHKCNDKCDMKKLYQYLS